MKITFAKKPSKVVTEIILTEGSDTRFIKRAGQVDMLSIGVGKRREINQRKFILLCRKVIRVAKQHKLTRIAVQFEKTPFGQLKKLS